MSASRVAHRKPRFIKQLARREAPALLRPNTGGTSQSRVPSAEGVRYAFSALQLPRPGDGRRI